MPKPLSVEEAWDVMSNNKGFISSAGYTLYKDGYFAYGTFPGCMRGGPSSRNLEEFTAFSEHNGHTKEWSQVSLQDIVEDVGYYPTSVSVFSKFQGMNLTTEEVQSAFELEQDMLDYCINSDYKSDDFKSGFAGDRIWKPWFADRQAQLNQEMADGIPE